jgi:hypothetical protein
MEDEWPSGVALRGEASNRPMLRWLKTVVVNDWGKGAHDASGGDREGVPEWSVQVGPGRASLLKRRECINDIETGGRETLGTSLVGVPLIDQVVSGV